MTNLAKIMLFALILGTFGIYTTSCNKSDSILDNVIEDNVQQTQISTTDNGWLYFADDAAMDAAYIDLIENFSEVEAWETKHNHKSLRARYEAAIEHISSIEEGSVNPQQLLKEYKDVLQVVGEGDEKETICIVDDMVIQALLNEDGIIQIGQRISKYSKNKIKTITDGDMSKLELLEKIDQTNDALSIEVTNLNDGAEKKCQQSYTSITRYITVGTNRRVRFSTTIKRRNLGPVYDEIYFNHQMNSQFRNWLFGWVNNNFSYSYRIVDDYHVVDHGTVLNPPPIIADGDTEYGWTGGSGSEVEKTDLCYVGNDYADLDVYYNFRFQATKSVAGTVDVPSWNNYDKWVYECW